ncbi:MAG: DNA polymerase III subunit gamma/tau [Candidatus Omnitrophota bacterium]|nr:DNA polymerase III subunit gamma/tau [Candidatus Omnitrophota bacterium]
MSYIVFARKYRPQAFDEVVGQSHITTTLKNAIAQNRVAHAYIFAGPRGVGKTTTARILAKALNCEKGPTDNPCNKCVSCNEITQGISLDILEIDGASNRGIDEIRNLRENVKFSPSKGRFKVYIIDEVHMLTAEAFNALLKTLEEPPAHVKFIFATTQAHKVPSTILSRCQRFDFRRISIKDIVDSLKSIAKKEGVKVDDDVLILIAKHSDGSMRDAQVVMDQISSFTEGKINIEDASKILGAVSDDILFGLADSIKQQDVVGALKIIDSLANEGKDIVQVILYMIEHFRNLSVIKVSKDPASLIDASAEKIKLYDEQARKFTQEEILYIIYTLSNTIDFVRKSTIARVPFEVAMIKLTRRGAIIPSGEIVERLERLEKGLKDGSVKGVSVSPKETSSEPQIQNQKPTTQKSAALDELITVWPAVLNCIKDRKISIAMYLKEGMPLNFETNTLSIEFPKSSKFHKEMLESPDCKSLILKAIKDISGLDIKIKLTISESDDMNSNATRDVFEESLGGVSQKDRNSQGDIDEPIINDALEIFGGEIENGNGKNGGRRV